jgi:hypothetical protein
MATSGPDRLPGYLVRRVREELEASLMEEAEMVFTTLSSTGRAVFGRLSRGFDLVLIDEAAQVRACVRGVREHKEKQPKTVYAVRCGACVCVCVCGGVVCSNSQNGHSGGGGVCAVWRGCQPVRARADGRVGLL